MALESRQPQPKRPHQPLISEAAGLKIVAAKMKQLSRAEAEGFYARTALARFFKARFVES
jgi:nucleoside diphosphate kinase